MNFVRLSKLTAPTALMFLLIPTTYGSDFLNVFLGAPEEEYKQVFTAWDENDFWGSWSDKYYTNHTRFSYAIDFDLDVPTSYFFSIGQEFYTPKNKATITAPVDDHPYAGFLYGTAGTSIRDNNFLISFEIQLGIVGPSAIGYEVQREWHKMIDEPIPSGWDSQIKDQLGANVMAEVRERFILFGTKNSAKECYCDPQLSDGFGSDLILRAFASLGTVRTMASVGAQLRFGKNLPLDFGYAPMRQSTSLVLPTNGEISIYGFVDLQGDAIAYDVTLGGELLRDSDTEIYKYPFAAEATLGIGINYGRWAIQFFQSFRTKDFSDADNSFFAFGGFRVSTSF